MHEHVYIFFKMKLIRDVLQYKYFLENIENY